MATEEKTTVYYDSDAEYSVKDMADWRDGDAPEENSREYWDILADLRDQDLDDLRLNLACSKCADIGPVVVCAHYHTRYPEFQHDRTGYRLADLSNIDSLFHLFHADGVKLYQDKDGLHIDAYHHDGSFTAHIRALNKGGRDYVDRIDGDPGYDQLVRLYSSRYSHAIKKALF